MSRTILVFLIFVLAIYIRAALDESATPSPTASVPILTQPSARSLLSKEQQMSRALATFNHQPIEFYGKVVDQNVQPVPGVNVQGGVMIQTKWMNGHIENH